MEHKQVVTVLVMGATSGEKKNKEKFYKVDLYLPGAGAFDRMVSPDEYVKFASMTPATPVAMEVSLVVREEKIPLAAGGSFSVRRLGVEQGPLSLPENARKAG